MQQRDVLIIPTINEAILILQKRQQKLPAGTVVPVRNLLNCTTPAAAILAPQQPWRCLIINATCWMK